MTAGAPATIFDARESTVEESAINPSYLLGLSGCNWHCLFCNVDQGERPGRPLTRTLYSQLVDEALDGGMRTMQFTGGEPTLHADALCELLAADHRVPAVLNTNLSRDLVGHPILPRVSALIGSVKFGNDECGRRLAGINGYTGMIRERAQRLNRALEGIIVRHLLMPGHLDCCFKPIATWIAKEMPGATLSLLVGYVPPQAAAGAQEILRCLKDSEVHEAVLFAQSHSLSFEVSAARVEAARAAVTHRSTRQSRAFPEEVEMVIDAAGRICFSGFRDSCAQLTQGLRPGKSSEG